jgi:hypothetical protein
MVDRINGFLDPGIRKCGIALFHGQSLVFARTVKNPMRTGNDYAACRSMALAVSIVFPRLDVLGIEWPRIYTAGKQMKDGHGTNPNDLLPLVGVGAAVAMSCPDAEIVRLYPDEWKGQVEKIAMNLRVLGRLSDVERKAVEAKDPDPGKPNAEGHDTWDAVGIGLHYLGRLDRVRVIAR